MDDLSIQSTGAVEVIVEMENGQRRWCFFMTPQALMACGDWIDGTQTRIHYGCPHMIVISQPFDEKIIRLALRHIEHDGKLEACTIPCDSKSS